MSYLGRTHEPRAGGCVPHSAVCNFSVSGFCYELFSQPETLGLLRHGEKCMKVHTADVTLQKANKSTVLLLVDKQTRGNPSDRSLVYSLHSLLVKALPPSI